MDLKDIAKALSSEFRPNDPEHFRLGVWHDGDTLENSTIKISKDLDSDDAFIDILDKKGTGKGSVSDITKLKKKFNDLRGSLPPGSYGLRADHPTKAKMYVRDFLKQPGFELSGEQGGARVFDKKLGKKVFKKFDTLTMTVPEKYPDFKTQNIPRSDLTKIEGGKDIYDIAKRSNFQMNRTLSVSQQNSDKLVSQFTTPDITQEEYLRRQNLLYGEDLKSYRRKLYKEGSSGKRKLDLIHLSRPGIEDDLRGVTDSGTIKSSFPSEPGKQLHHGNPVGNTASIFKGAAQWELNRLWKLQNELKLPLGNDIRNLFEFDEDLHQKGKRVGIQDIHEWGRSMGLDKDYMLDEKGKPIKNPTIEQREAALRRVASDWHKRWKPEIMKRQFEESIIGNDTYTPVEGQRYDRQGKFEKAVVGYKDVHIPIDERLELTTEQALARKKARHTKGATLRKARENNPGAFNQPEIPGHNLAASKRTLPTNLSDPNTTSLINSEAQVKAEIIAKDPSIPNLTNVKEPEGYFTKIKNHLTTKGFQREAARLAGQSPNPIANIAGDFVGVVFDGLAVAANPKDKKAIGELALSGVQLGASVVGGALIAIPDPLTGGLGYVVMRAGDKAAMVERLWNMSREGAEWSKDVQKDIQLNKRIKRTTKVK